MTVRVNQGSYNVTNDNSPADPRANRRGELVVIDFWTQLVLDGRMFHMQIGTEDAPVNSTTSIDDELVWMVADNAVGMTMLPAFYSVSLAQPATGNLINAMLEVDRGKVRWSSGGTAFIPENLRTDRPRVSQAIAYVGTDITVGAKTAVPGSLEIARISPADTTPSATNEACDFLAFTAPIYNARMQNIPVAIVGTGSLLAHFGCATADATGYGVLQWGEIPTDSVT